MLPSISSSALERAARSFGVEWQVPLILTLCRCSFHNKGSSEMHLTGYFEPDGTSGLGLQGSPP